MNYTQVTLPNYDIPYTGGLCEKYVENTVGLNGVYPSATAAWNADNVNYYDLPPKGLRVPVYFSLGTNPNGHVAIQLEDGRVASSTQAGYHKTAYIHPNLQDLINVYAKHNGGCTYLGFSGYIGKVEVIREGDDMDKIQDNDSEYDRFAHLSANERGGKPFSREYFSKNVVGMEVRTFIDLTINDPQAAERQNALNNPPSGDFVKVSDLYIKKG